MSEKVGRIIDVVGMALILGLLLRYAGPASQLLATAGNVGIRGYQAVSLQPVTS